MGTPTIFASIAGALAVTVTNLPDIGSPLTIIGAVAFGVWLMTKRKDTQAHEIIVGSVTGAKERERSDDQKIATLMQQMAAMQVEQTAANIRQNDANKVMVAQAGDIGGLKARLEIVERQNSDLIAANEQLRVQNMALQADLTLTRADLKAANETIDEQQQDITVLSTKLKDNGLL